MGPVVECEVMVCVGVGVVGGGGGGRWGGGGGGFSGTI